MKNLIVSLERNGVTEAFCQTANGSVPCGVLRDCIRRISHRLWVFRLPRSS